jgi:hypothetical protein
MEEWYYTKMGLQQGPVPKDELLAKIRRGDVGESNLVWTDGMAEWLPSAKVPALRPAPPVYLNYPGMPPVLPQAPVSAPALAPEKMGNIPLPQPPAYHGNYVAPVIPNYMWQSVVATVLSLFSCLIIAMPLGIVAIVYASKVEGFRVQGNILEASHASRNARGWMIASFTFTGIWMFFGMLIVLIGRG